MCEKRGSDFLVPSLLIDLILCFYMRARTFSVPPSLLPLSWGFPGDTALHDVARFGHVQAATMLLEAGTNPHLRNAEGYTAAQLADQYEKTALAEVCRAFESRHAANASNGSNRRKGGGAGGCATFEDKWVAATDFVSTSGADRAAILAKPACSA